MRRKNGTRLLILAVGIFVVTSMYFFYLRNMSSKTSLTIYSTLNECEQETGNVCLFSQCDYKCPEGEGYKAWIPSSKKLTTFPVPTLASETFREYENLETGCFNICNGTKTLIECEEDNISKYCDYQCLGNLINSCDK